MSNKLIAYFSCTNNTKRTAQDINKILDADMFEIVPKEPYTVGDLNWNDSTSRSTKECNDASCRPEIKNAVSDMNSYEYVVIGAPIWWYKFPNIINTFIEQYDFAGKKVILFATSGSSDVSGCEKALKENYKDLNIIGAKTLNRYSIEDIEDWLEKLGVL